eukprot:gene45563-57160_t
MCSRDVRDVLYGQGGTISRKTPAWLRKQFPASAGLPFQIVDSKGTVIVVGGPVSGPAVFALPSSPITAPPPSDANSGACVLGTFPEQQPAPPRVGGPSSGPSVWAPPPPSPSNPSSSAPPIRDQG